MPVNALGEWMRLNRKAEKIGMLLTHDEAGAVSIIAPNGDTLPVRGGLSSVRGALAAIKFAGAAARAPLAPYVCQWIDGDGHDRCVTLGARGADLAVDLVLEYIRSSGAVELADALKRTNGVTVDALTAGMHEQRLAAAREERAAEWAAERADWSRRVEFLEAELAELRERMTASKRARERVAERHGRRRQGKTLIAELCEHANQFARPDFETTYGKTRHSVAGGDFGEAARGLFDKPAQLGPRG